MTDAVQGDREHLTDLVDLQPVLDDIGERATLRVIEGADHFYNLPDSSGKSRRRP